MTPHKQLFRHNPSEGLWGDCERTAIACLLDMVPAEVPHWNEGCDGVGPVQPHAMAMRRDWLAARGLFLVSIPFVAASLSDVMEFVTINHPDIHYLVGGGTSRGVNHCIICRNREVIHDPHPDDTFLTGPCDDGYWWVNFLGKIT